MDWYPLLNSLRIAAISAVAVFFAGIAAAYYIAKLPRLVKGILDVILTLPLVLPPTVVGYLLLRVLGPKRLIGAWVLETFGKSVTLKCIAGIMTPDKGRIVLDGETLFDSEAHIDLTLQQRRVGYLFQQYALFPNMTVAQNIQCGIRTGSRAEKQQQQQAAEQLRRFQLEGLEKKFPAQLSGGQQRVALARILASEPRAILLDEPFSALDSFLKWNLELELADLLAGFGGPILWVSHDLGECYRNCKTVCVMENGVSSPVTDMKTLVQHPATQGAARLAGCRNFLPTRRCGDGVRIDGWDITLPLKADAEQVTVAIPDSAIALGDGPYTARVFRVIQDLETSVVQLQPEHAPDAVMIRAAADIGSATPGEAIAFRLQAEKCLCY